MNDSNPTDATKHLPPVLRSVLALIVGTVVFELALLATWQQYRSWEGLRWEQHETDSSLKQIDRAIAKYRESAGQAPVTLAELESDNLVASHALADGWGRPMLYERQGEDRLVVKSLGRDGRPGGRGLDYDLTLGSFRSDSASFPTLTQFLFVLPTETMVETCVLSGGMAAALAWVLLKNVPWPLAGNLELLIKVFLTAFAAIVIGVFLAGLHLPPSIEHH